MSTKLLKKFLAQHSFSEHCPENNSKLINGATTGKKRAVADNITEAKRSCLSGVPTKVDEILRFDRMRSISQLNASAKLDEKKRTKRKEGVDGSGVGNSRSSFKQARLRLHEPTITKKTKEKARRQKEHRKLQELVERVRKDAAEKARKKDK
mmetsp:Transcript_25444/g.36466  ORF Transcript_25444/g.36466 Transcript_25444/m.36466 type:complete len:152 (+) Transcript_25444:67-522(+)